MVQQLTIKLSIDPSLLLAAIDTDYGIYLFQGQEAVKIAFFLSCYIDMGLDLSNIIMGFTNKNQELASQLLADAKSLLQENFSEGEYDRVFSIIEQSESRGLLGPDRPFDDRLGELVNIANEILRNRGNFDEVEVSSLARQPRALYVYVALVAVGLISA
jgi:hypothetical protein